MKFAFTDGMEIVIYDRFEIQILKSPFLNNLLRGSFTHKIGIGRSAAIVSILYAFLV